MYPLSSTLSHDVARATDSQRLEGFRRWTRRHADGRPGTRREARPATRTDTTAPARRSAGR